MLKKIWEGWKKIGLFVGNIISTVVLTVFYYTIFPFFAVPYRIFSKYGRSIVGDTNFSSPNRQMDNLEDFRKEF